MLAEIVRRVERQKSGIIEAGTERLGEPVVDHLAEYRRHLESKGRSEFHVAETARLITKVTEACRIKLLKELQGSRERIEQHLAARLAEGWSHRTANGDLTAIRSFCRWLVQRRLLSNDPTVGISKLNEDEDRRRERRALTDEEAQLLIVTTRSSERVFRGLTGEDRAVMYTLAQRTGLRRKELCSLSPSSFDLASTPPIVRVRAGDSKHRKADVLPLAADVAELLRNYLAGRPNTKPIWPRSWWRRSAEMLYADLEAAGIKPEADDGTVVDFHGTFITELARVGNSPIAVQKLARHSDFNLTLRTYTRLQIDDLVDAVERLPTLGGTGGGKGQSLTAPEPIPNMPDDARLRDLVAVWPTLPEHLKNAIAMLTGSLEGKAPPQERRVLPDDVPEDHDRGKS